MMRMPGNCSAIKQSRRQAFASVGTAIVLAVLCATPIAAEEAVAVFDGGEDRSVLTYLDASCADNFECQIAHLSCYSFGLRFTLINVSDQDATKLLRDGVGVRLNAGGQSAVLLPTDMAVNEAGEGWVLTFSGWRSAGEEIDALVDAMATSPVDLAEVARSVDFDMPTSRAALVQQQMFAAACRKLR
jgi:hypothetical protein